jgi:hypothetical protein
VAADSRRGEECVERKMAKDVHQQLDREMMHRVDVLVGWEVVCRLLHALVGFDTFPSAR